MSQARTEPLPAAAELPQSPSKASPRNLIVGAVAAIALVVGATYGIKRWQFAGSHEETDDAQVEGHISPVLPRIAGYVTRVLISDNQHVNAGDPLVEIDSRELDLRVAAADAAVKNAAAQETIAEASLATARAEAVTAGANVRTSLVRQRKAASDLERDERLFKTGAITDSQLTDTRAAADTAASQLESVQSQGQTAGLEIAVATARVAQSRTEGAQRAADLEYAKLQRSYASVTSPISGFVSRKNIEAGQYVESGQSLLSIASEEDVWVVANFKETQLTRIKPGQDAAFEVDSYPGVAFRGKVESISAATGARFALLPPDNSTGNFVKVTQRVPVKILLAQPPDADHPLRPGMSVDATVAVSE